MKSTSRIQAMLAVVCGIAASTSVVAQEVEPTAYQRELMSKLDTARVPAQNFKLAKWKITLPMEDSKPERQGKVMEVFASELNSPTKPYLHPDWFYTDARTGAMVFKAPNAAMTTQNSSNTRSELRAMLDTRHDDKPKDLINNFALAAHPQAKEFGAIGGRMTAALTVDWVSTSGNDTKYGAHAVVIGQIHGSSQEPLKIFYRKLPNHQHGSLFWNYEINPADKKNRFDIPHDIFGSHTLTKADKDPVGGIKLGELFEYDVNVVGNIMTLTFTKNPGLANEQVVTHRVNLAAPHAASPLDLAYGQDSMYFKAGAYNQCNLRSTACTNNGLAAGDYTQASFYKLELTQ